MALDASTRKEPLVIQKAFLEGVKSRIVTLLPEGICNHAAIAPELYADALILTAVLGWYNYMRRFLLKQADRYDLEAVKEKVGYAGLNPEFRDTIEEALGKAAPGGTRTRTYDIQSAEKARETFKELRHDGIPTDIAELISAYVTVYVPTRREGRIAAKKVTSDVTEIATKTKIPRDTTSSRKSIKKKKNKGKRKGRGKKNKHFE